MTFEEFKKQYKIYSLRNDKTSTNEKEILTWYADSKIDPHYRAYGASQEAVLWALEQTYECTVNRVYNSIG